MGDKYYKRKNTKRTRSVCSRRKLCKRRNILTDRVFLRTFYNDRITLEKHHKPIVSKEIFNKTQKALKRRSHTTRHSYIASGLIKCNECKCMLYAEPSYNKNGVLYKYYYCRECKQRVSEKNVLKELEPDLCKHSILQGEYNNINFEKFKRIVRKETELNNKVLSHDITDKEYFIESSKLSHLKQN